MGAVAWQTRCVAGEGKDFPSPALCGVRKALRVMATIGFRIGSKPFHRLAMRVRNGVA